MHDRQFELLDPEQVVHVASQNAQVLLELSLYVSEGQVEVHCLVSVL